MIAYLPAACYLQPLSTRPISTMTDNWELRTENCFFFSYSLNLEYQAARGKPATFGENLFLLPATAYKIFVVFPLLTTFFHRPRARFHHRPEQPSIKKDF